MTIVHQMFFKMVRKSIVDLFRLKKLYKKVIK